MKDNDIYSLETTKKYFIDEYEEKKKIKRLFLNFNDEFNLFKYFLNDNYTSFHNDYDSVKNFLNLLKLIVKRTKEKKVIITNQVYNNRGKSIVVDFGVSFNYFKNFNEYKTSEHIYLCETHIYVKYKNRYLRLESICLFPVLKNIIETSAREEELRNKLSLKEEVTKVKEEIKPRKKI